MGNDAHTDPAETKKVEESQPDVLHASIGHVEGGYFAWIVYHGIEISSNHHQTLPAAIAELSKLTERLWDLPTVLSDLPPQRGWGV